jgi:peroxiredoxin Q/BCP
LDDFRGRKLLVYFYPEADTPGCTTQSCECATIAASRARGGVVGISPDETAKQLAFTRSLAGFRRCRHRHDSEADTWGENAVRQAYRHRGRRSDREDGVVERAWYRVADRTVPSEGRARQLIGIQSGCGLRG